MFFRVSKFSCDKKGRRRFIKVVMFTYIIFWLFLSRMLHRNIYKFGINYPFFDRFSLSVLSLCLSRTRFLALETRENEEKSVLSMAGSVSFIGLRVNERANEHFILFYLIGKKRFHQIRINFEFIFSNRN